MKVDCKTMKCEQKPSKFVNQLNKVKKKRHETVCRCTVASWFIACSSPDQVVRVRALARDIVLCSWARHFTLLVALSTRVYKWVPTNLMLGVTDNGSVSHPVGSRNTPNRFMLQKREISSGLMGHLARMKTLPYLHLLLDLFEIITLVGEPI